MDLYFGGQPPCLTGLRARWEGDTTPPPTFTCRELRECDSVAVRVPQHGVRLNRISHITLAYVFTHLGPQGHLGRHSENGPQMCRFGAYGGQFSGFWTPLGKWTPDAPFSCLARATAALRRGPGKRAPLGRGCCRILDPRCHILPPPIISDHGFAGDVPRRPPERRCAELFVGGWRERGLHLLCVAVASLMR